MQAFKDLGQQPRFFRIPPGAYADQFGLGLRVACGKKAYIMATRYKPLGDQRNYAFPRPIVSWRRSPGNGGEHGNLHGAIPIAFYPVGYASQASLASLISVQWPTRCICPRLRSKVELGPLPPPSRRETPLYRHPPSSRSFFQAQISIRRSGRAPG